MLDVGLRVARLSCRLILVLALVACVTVESDPGPGAPKNKASSEGPVVGSALVSVQPLEVSDATRRVSVEVPPGRTVLKVGKTTITFRGHEGYRGRLTPRAGWLRVGDLSVSYDETRLQLRSPKGWANVDLAEGLNLHADQDGTVGRSIFKS